QMNSVDSVQEPNDEDENLISNLDETYANDTEYRVIESDVLEDDLLIEALNSRFGPAIASRTANPSRVDEKIDDLSENSEKEQAELEQILRQLSSDKGKLDEPEF
ncbi:hypothetical protein HDU80_003703, partial [Chytriomyces hyalinus]